MFTFEFDAEGGTNRQIDCEYKKPWATAWSTVIGEPYQVSLQGKIHLTTIPKRVLKLLGLRSISLTVSQAQASVRSYLLEFGKVSRSLLAVLGGAVAELVLCFQDLHSLLLQLSVRAGGEVSRGPVSGNVGLGVRLNTSVANRGFDRTHRVNARPANISALLLLVSLGGRVWRNSLRT